MTALDSLALKLSVNEMFESDLDDILQRPGVYIIARVAYSLCFFCYFLRIFHFHLFPSRRARESER